MPKETFEPFAKFNRLYRAVAEHPRQRVGRADTLRTQLWRSAAATLDRKQWRALRWQRDIAATQLSIGDVCDCLRARLAIVDSGLAVRVRHLRLDGLRDALVDRSTADRELSAATAVDRSRWALKLREVFAQVADLQSPSEVTRLLPSTPEPPHAADHKNTNGIRGIVIRR